MIPVIIIISIMLFGMMKIMPGDPAERMVPLNPSADPSQRAEAVALMRERLGLNRPIYIQYFRWIRESFQGNFGYSTYYNGPVDFKLYPTQRYINGVEVTVMQRNKILSEPLRNSIILNVFSISIAFLISIPVGIKSAVKRFSVYDTGWQVFSLVGISMPTFFIGLFLIFALAFKLTPWVANLSVEWGLRPADNPFRMFPAGGMPSFPQIEEGRTTLTPQQNWDYSLQFLRHLMLPILTLTIGSLAGTVRYVRNAMLEVIKKDFIRTARSKGLSEKVVIYSHAFRNALIPVVTIVAGSLVGIFGGSAITESVFVYHGIGQVLITALTNQDYAIVLVMNMFYATLALFANLIMDISYAFVDPRVKLD
jgi:peptide/nickel transport system permease protein